MDHWNLDEIETTDGSRSPVVVHSRDGERRAVLLELESGQTLGEHQVKEAALLLVLDGRVRVDAGETSLAAGPRTLFRFDPDERRSVASEEGARLLLLLAPWPGAGHYRGDPAGAGVDAG